MNITSKVKDYYRQHKLSGFINFPLMVRKLVSYLLLHDDVRAVFSLRFNRTSYDKSNNVDTDKVEFPDNLTIDSSNREFATYYQATPVKLFKRVLQSIPADLEQFHFIDIGSGKGRVLLMASEWPFKTIVGYEFARELHEVALRNVRRLPSTKQKCFHITPLHADAVDCELPDGNVVIFMFNPFSRELVMRFARRLVTCARGKNSLMYLCYVKPIHADVFIASECFHIIKRDLTFTIFKFAG